ncbi:hypothetical protein [Nocardiopsis baichengensis]|uniref:hypothetical protein n=1 Tax=Nocardiopsis baichengensis TaxID=280240 RepID=UPI00034AFF03|nr:hypothetical protein [Nocardiopsis baichengensis]
MLIDGRTGEPVVPQGSLGFGYGREGGRWNLRLGDNRSPLRLYADGCETALADLPRFDGGGAETIRRSVPVREIGGHLVTTVFDPLLAQHGVGRSGLPGMCPSGYGDATQPCPLPGRKSTPVPPADKAGRIGRESAANAEESRGRSMVIVGPAPTTGSSPPPSTGPSWP